MKKPRYRLHWAFGDAPRPSLKWAVYDWVLNCAVAYAERRADGRKICDFLNHLVEPCCEHREEFHETVEYRGDKPRACTVGACSCKAFRNNREMTSGVAKP